MVLLVTYLLLLFQLLFLEYDFVKLLNFLYANYQVDLGSLREAAGAACVELADEGEFKGRFPQCEVGAMPPFGNLYGMAVYADKELAEDDEIAFNAGTHTEPKADQSLNFSIPLMANDGRDPLAASRVLPHRSHGPRPNAHSSGDSSPPGTQHMTASAPGSTWAAWSRGAHWQPR